MAEFSATVNELATVLEGATAGASKDAFGDQVASCLAEDGFLRRFQDVDLIRSLLVLNDLPQRPLENSYGQPTLTIWRGDAFRIELIFWRKGPTVYIHDHIAGGAFAVLSGRRIHSRYEFRAICADQSGCEMGLTRTLSSDLIEPGEIVAIPPGSGLIHSLTYIEDPGVTLSIRQNSRNSSLCNRSGAEKHISLYVLPSLRLSNGFGLDQEKYTELLNLCNPADDNRIHALLREMVAKRSLAFCVSILCSRWAFAYARHYRKLAELMCDQYPSYRNYLTPAFEYYLNYSIFTLISRRLSDSQALLCSLLFSNTKPEQIFEIFSRVFTGGNSIKLITDTLSTLSELRIPLDGLDCKMLEGSFLGESQLRLERYIHKIAPPISV